MTRHNLTEHMRAFLGAQEARDAYLYDAIFAFMREFNLDARSASRLVARWIRETF
jgi:hypothetical protein